MTATLVKRIQSLKKEKNAVILAHTYQPGPIQDIADFVGDSYGLSVEAAAVDADSIIFCGVMFMAETAAILNPHKKVIIPDAAAGCPMADMIDVSGLMALRRRHPDYMVITYVNSTAEIKALSDICCTSSNAVKIVRGLPEDKGIIFVPDKHLGSYVREQTGRTMVLWNGFCPTHVKITPPMVLAARQAHTRAVVIMHPEAPPESRTLADRILSTGQMCSFVESDERAEYIVATETGVIHTLEKRNPAKRFFLVDDSITCPNMKKCTLELVAGALEGSAGMRVTVPRDIAVKAEQSLRRMLEMSA